MGARNADALSSWIPKADSPLVQFLTIFYLRIISKLDENAKTQIYFRHFYQLVMNPNFEGGAHTYDFFGRKFSKCSKPSILTIYIINWLQTQNFKARRKKGSFRCFRRARKIRLVYLKKNNDFENFLQTLLAREKTSSALYNKLDAKKMGIVK